jgi:hypothetical protein
MLTTSKLTVGGIDVKAIHGFSSKSPIIYGTTTDGVFAGLAEAEHDSCQRTNVAYQLSEQQASILREMVVLGYHPFEALQAVLELKKPGVGQFKSLRDLEKWLDEMRLFMEEERERTFWNFFLVNPKIATVNGKVVDPFNHPLWEDRNDPAYYWN